MSFFHIFLLTMTPAAISWQTPNAWGGSCRSPYRGPRSAQGERTCSVCDDPNDTSYAYTCCGTEGGQSEDEKALDDEVG